MANLSRIVIYLIFAYQSLVAVGQSVEQECNILNTLDTLSTKVEQLEALSVKVENLEALSVKVENLEGLSVKVDKLEASSVKVENLEASSVKVEQLEALSMKLENQIKDMTHNAGSTYIRWGRTSCPGNGSELVYSGYAGGSHYSHTGAAVDYLCLPQDPIFDHYEDTAQISAFVYGAEYQFIDKADRMAFFPGIDPTHNILNKDVPCAVCTTQRARVMMVPARNMCHDGWTLEYKGYLSTGYFNHAAASQYVCLDDQPELFTGVHDYHDGKLFFFVEGRCGSLRCPPYVNGRELTCAICSK